jgi:septum formation protein
LASRLALAKAREVHRQHQDALVIGSDQVASVDDQILGKPGGFAAARAQLQVSSGRAVQFFTGVALVGKGQEQFHVERFSVHFRVLDDTQIERYLRREEPYDCAGSFKCEGLGIALFTRMEGDDPTSLEGLPLISLASMLGRAGRPVI